jgi:hypothetical protein
VDVATDNDIIEPQVKSIVGGLTWAVSLSSSSSSLDLKRGIMKNGGPPIELQRLLFRGRELDDTVTLSNVEMVSGSEVFLLRRLD